LKLNCAYVLGNQIDPTGKPECKENQSKTMIMKPRLWGDSKESGCAYVPGIHNDSLGKPECKENQSETMIMKPRLWGESLEPGCAYVPGTQIDLLGTPECKENQSKTMIMKPRLWGESLESGCAYVPGNQIDPLGKPECKENQSKTMIMEPRLRGERFGIRLRLCTCQSDRPPWQAGMQGKQIKNNDYDAQAVGGNLKSGCAYVPGTQIDPLGKPECKENQSKTMIMEPRLRGERFGIRLRLCTWQSDRPPWQARMQGKQIKNYDYKAQAVGVKIEIRLCIFTWHSDRPPWQARMQGKLIENNDYGAQAAGGKVWNQAALMYLAIRSTPLASQNARKTNQKH
jgi:hypothetical protein